MTTRFRVMLGVPGFGAITGEWQPDASERSAAWELYVELVTRISIVELKPDEGLIRDALSSLYTLFGSTRTILRKYGPAVAPKRRRGQISLGTIALAMLNLAIRPILTRWHPRLEDYELSRPATVSRLQHERAWDLAPTLRAELNELRAMLIDTANLLAAVAHAGDAIPLTKSATPT